MKPVREISLAQSMIYQSMVSQDKMDCSPCLICGKVSMLVHGWWVCDLHGRWKSMGIPADAETKVSYRYDDIPAVVTSDLVTSSASFDEEKSDQLFGPPRSICAEGHLSEVSLESGAPCPQCGSPIRIARITNYLQSVIAARRCLSDKFKPTEDLLDKLISCSGDNLVVGVDHGLAVGGWVEIRSVSSIHQDARGKVGLVIGWKQNYYAVSYAVGRSGVFRENELRSIATPSGCGRFQIGQKVVVDGPLSEGVVVGTHPDSRIGVFNPEIDEAGLFNPDQVSPFGIVAGMKL